MPRGVEVRTREDLALVFVPLFVHDEQSNIAKTPSFFLFLTKTLTTLSTKYVPPMIS